MKKFCFILSIFLSINSFCQSNLIQKDSTSLNEVIPEFPGGIKAYYKYINQNFKYPKSALKAGYMGKVIVKFMVEKDGKVKVDSLNNSAMAFRNKRANEELRQLAIKEMDIAIINHFESMPMWKPGMQKGQNVRVSLSTPFSLQLE